MHSKYTHTSVSLRCQTVRLKSAVKVTQVHFYYAYMNLPLWYVDYCRITSIWLRTAAWLEHTKILVWSDWTTTKKI